MPVNIRRDGKAKRIALDILGPPACGLVDAFGNKKRFVRKKEKLDAEEEGNSINRFEEIGYR